VKKFLAAAAIAASFAAVAPAEAQQAAICNESGCLGRVPRCFYWTDYPTCIYPWPIIP
jgi:hypothetical protein